MSHTPQNPAAVREFESCPGCAAEFLPSEGPTHAYIGAHAGCWALYSAVLATGSPAPEMLEASRAQPLPDSISASRLDLAPLLVDAYAAQHHGESSPQAVQSIAVHLLTLHGVLERGHAVDTALWMRRRALRIRGVYRWLSPPERARSLALRQLWTTETDTNTAICAYVESVSDAWREVHGAQIARWFADHVAHDHPSGRSLRS